MAQFDDDSIVVYQAFRPEIAEYAVRNKRFEGCPLYNCGRMTWIKTNFLWMMFRAGWARKPHQQRILAIWLKQEAFEYYLENARSNGSVSSFPGTIRLQWDPDHLPNCDPHPHRRAVQLGLRDVETFRNGQDIVRIEDITEFVHSQADKALQKQEKAGGDDDDDLMVASERVYIPNSEAAKARVGLEEAPIRGKEDDTSYLF